MKPRAMKSNESDRDQRQSQNGKTPGEGLEKKNRMKGKESQQGQDWLPSQDVARRPPRTPCPQDHQYFIYTQWILQPRKRNVL